MREACLAARLLLHAQHAAITLESNQEALLDKRGASGCVPVQRVLPKGTCCVCTRQLSHNAQVCFCFQFTTAFSGCIHTSSALQLASKMLTIDLDRTSVTA